MHFLGKPGENPIYVALLIKENVACGAHVFFFDKHASNYLSELEFLRIKKRPIIDVRFSSHA